MGGEKELQKAYESILAQHFEEAADWFLKAIDQDPENPSYHYKLSITYARSGRYEEALEQALKARQLQPEKMEHAIQVRTLQAKLLCKEAEKLLDSKKEADVLLAAAQLQEALRLDPLEGRGYVLLASAYVLLKEYKEAIAKLKELLELHPEHEEAQALLKQVTQQFMEYLEESS